MTEAEFKRFHFYIIGYKEMPSLFFRAIELSMNPHNNEEICLLIDLNFRIDPRLKSRERR
jgi:hypothetical protein